MKNKIILLFILLQSLHFFAQETWYTHTKKADSLQLKFNFKGALEYRKKALANQNDIPKDSITFLKLLKKISQEELNIKDKELKKEAYKKLTKYIIKLEEIGAKPKRLYQANRRMYIFAHNYMRDMKATSYYIEKSIKYHFASAKIDSTILLKTMHSSGVISRELGDLKKSAKTFNESILLYNASKKKDTNMLGAIYVDLSSLYGLRYLNIPQEHDFYLKKAVQIFSTLEKPNLEYLTSIYIRLGSSEKDRGNYKEAIGYYNKGYDLYLSNKEEVQKFRMAKIGVLRDLLFTSYLLELYSLEQNKEKTESTLNTIFNLTKNVTLTARESDFLTTSYLFAGRYYKSINKKLAYNYIDKGIKLNQKKSEEYIIPQLLLEKVSILLSEKKYKKAKKIIEKLLRDKKLKDYQRLKNFNQATLVYSKLNDSINTFKNLNKSLNYINKQKEFIDIKTMTYQDYIPSPDLTSTTTILNIAGYLKKSSFQVPTIIDKLYWLALKQYKQNYTALNKELNKPYSKIIAYFHNKMAKNQLNLQQKEEIIDFMEFVDGNYLLNKFNENRILANNTKDDLLYQKEQFTRSNITYLKKKLLNKHTDSLQQLIFEENLKLKGIRDSLKIIKKGYSQIADYTIYKNNLKQLKAAYIIKYKVIDSSLYRTVFYNENIQTTNLGNYESLKGKIETYITMVKDIKTPIKSIKEKGHELYNYLFKGLNSKDIKDLYIVPDKILHFFPFELLVDNNNEYLVKQSPISYATALVFLKAPLEHIKINTHKVALFAPSYKQKKPSEEKIPSREFSYHLQGAIDEVKSISKITNSELFLNNEATKDAFQNISNNFSVIHLSMHSFLNDKDSELNSLVFTDNDEDNEIAISELYGLNLNANMVVLSACNTGVGEIKTGNGVISLNTAFIASGVPSVLSSLWSSPDNETKNIMVSFYKNLNKGYSKKKALQLAKLTNLNAIDSDTKHPFYWAGFVIYGDSAPIELSNNHLVYYIFIALLLGFLILFYFLKKNRSKISSLK